MSGYGGVVSFELRGGLEGASKFIDALRIPYIAPSFGGVESLVEQPTVMSYWDQTPERRAEIGIRDSLVRYACGIEDSADLIADIEQALERI
jgi:cystathionine gamma-synthase